MAGLRYTFDLSQPVGERVSDVEVQEGEEWVPLDPEATYGIVTNDFVRNGGDGYALFASNAIDPYDFGPPLENVLADYIAAQGTGIIIIKGIHQWRRLGKSWNYTLHLSFGLEGQLWHLYARYKDQTGEITLTSSCSAGKKVTGEAHDSFVTVGTGKKRRH